MIIIKENQLKDILKINIPEFEQYSKDYFLTRIKDKPHLILIAYFDNQPVGYIIAYDRFNDSSLYCWMAGVSIDFRRKGILTALMNYQEQWAKKHHYKKIKIKTRNSRREMISYLTKSNFLFLEVIQKENIKENRILLEKKL